jgi:hypothetical protein
MLIDLIDEAFEIAKLVHRLCGKISINIRHLMRSRMDADVPLFWLEVVCWVMTYRLEYGDLPAFKVMIRLDILAIIAIDV